MVNAGVAPQGKEGAHFKFTTTSPAKAVIALGQILQAQNITLTDLRMKRPTLEDVYISLVGKVTEEEKLN